jgi:hypothetical protein
MKNPYILTLRLSDIYLLFTLWTFFFSKLVEHITSFKIILNHRNKCVVLKISSLAHFSKTMKHSFILILCLSDICLFSTSLALFLSELVDVITGYKIILNYRGNYVCVKNFLPLRLTKPMKNSHIATIICLTYPYFSLGQNYFFRVDKTSQELERR